MIVGVGIDIAEVARLDRALTRTRGLAERLFTAAERGEAGAERSVHSLAGRFAAKEAAFKALGGERAHWQEVEVVRGASGAPSLVLHGRTAELAAARGASTTHCSITHDGGLAAAVVVLEAAP